MNRVKSDNKLRKDVSGYFLKILNIARGKMDSDHFKRLDKTVSLDHIEPFY